MYVKKLFFFNSACDTYRQLCNINKTQKNVLKRLKRLKHKKTLFFWGSKKHFFCNPDWRINEGGGHHFLSWVSEGGREYFAKLRWGYVFLHELFLPSPSINTEQSLH